MQHLGGNSTDPLHRGSSKKLQCLFTVNFGAVFHPYFAHPKGSANPTLSREVDSLGKPKKGIVQIGSVLLEERHSLAFFSSFYNKLC